MDKEGTSAVTIKAVGDICPGDKYIMGLGVSSKTKRFGVDFPLDKVRGLLKQGDLVVGNLEGVLSDKVRNRKKGPDLTFCGLPEFGDALARAGFNVINIANNHSFEHGPEIFLETVDHLRKAGLKICGLRGNGSAYYSEPVVLTVNGRRFGIIGYNWVGVNNFFEVDRYIAQSHDSLVNYTWERDKKNEIPISKANSLVVADIRRLRKEVDVVILIAHWGYEFVRVPPYNLTLEAQTFIEAGANIIIGCHPHVLQGVQKYRGGHIFYSLGNFIFDSRARKQRNTALLEVTLDKKQNISYKLTPLRINRFFQPEVGSSKQGRYIRGEIEKSSQSLLSLNRKEVLDDDKVYRKYEKYYNASKLFKAFNHFIAIGEDPSVIRLIFKKGIGFLRIMWWRLKGKKVRW
jgi:poly-gamma-glutamate capsule biosynthesis protein CapA/YwtB (metallophosphatase superfamily)